MSIKLEDISKRYGQTQALDAVSVSFGGQKIYGLLGNNGAGKTTMLNVITGRVVANSGTLTLDGAPIPDNDAALGQMYLLGEKNFYPNDTKVKEVLRTTAFFYPNYDLGYALELAQRFDLPLNKKISALSTGYKSIFKIVVALATRAPYLLLDEPVLGLDAAHRDMFYKLLLEHYTENPCTIVISTHLIAEVANIVEHCVIIKDGRIIKDAPCEQLLRGGYTVSGPTSQLNDFLRGKDVLSVSNIGGLSTACISGELPGDLPGGLEAGALGLQEYFIQLSNSKEANRHE